MTDNMKGADQSIYSPSPIGAGADVESDVHAGPEIDGLLPSEHKCRRQDEQVDLAEQEEIARRKNGDYQEHEIFLLAAWFNSESWADFIGLNRYFLRGELPMTCYSMGGIYNETKPLIPGLLRLHDYGILTTWSQPHRNTLEKIKHCCHEGYFYGKTEQRSFLSFLFPQKVETMPRATLQAFLVELMVHDDLYVSILNAKEGELNKDGCTIVPQATTFPDDWFSKHMRTCDEDEDITDSQARFHDSKGFKPHCACVLKAFSTGEGHPVIETAQPLVISVLAKRWDNEDLIEKVEQVAEKVGLPKVYGEDSWSTAVHRVMRMLVGEKY